MDTKALLERNGIPTPIVSGGSSSTYAVTGLISGMREIQAGTYATMDWRYQQMAPEFEVALSILIRVISRPRPGAAVLDIGVKGAREYDTRLKLANFRSLERTLATLANDSEVAAAALNLYRYYFPKSVMAVAARKMGEIDLKSCGQLEVAPEAGAALKREHQEKYLTPFQERVEKLIVLARESGIEPVFLTQPALYGNGVDEITGVDLRTVKVTPEMNGKVAWEVLELYNDVIRELGKQAGVLVIDLARELPQEPRYYYDLMHYTQEGSERVAAIIDTHLSPWLARKFPAYCSRPVP
jgi:hypothetical protein